MGQKVTGWGGEGVEGAAGSLDKGVEGLQEDLQMKEDLQPAAGKVRQVGSWALGWAAQRCQPSRPAGSDRPFCDDRNVFYLHHLIHGPPVATQHLKCSYD